MSDAPFAIDLTGSEEDRVRRARAAEGALLKAGEVVKKLGASPWRYWPVVFAIARWLAGADLELHPNTQRKAPTMDPEDLAKTLDDEVPELGKKYEDEATGFVGTATGVYHYLDGSTRVGLEALNDGKPIELTVDAGRLHRYPR